MSAAQHGAMALSGIAKIKQLLEEQDVEGGRAGQAAEVNAAASAEAAAANHAADLDPTQLAQVLLLSPHRHAACMRMGA